MVLRKLTRDDVEISVEVEQDDIPVKGNALASGDEETDRQAEQEILRRLDDGDVWAWCHVTVTVTWKGFSESRPVVLGCDGLGACSYADEADFRQPGGYFDDMVERALDDLNETLARTHTTLAELVETERKGE